VLRLVLDTNVRVSALLSPKGPPGQLLTRSTRLPSFTLVSADAQIDEILRVAAYPKIRARVAPKLFHDLVDDLHALATCVASPLPVVTASPDPDDNVLLAIAGAGLADLLVTGDKRDLLSLQTHGAVRVVTARAALERIG
jgi:hypothetical protein